MPAKPPKAKADTKPVKAGKTRLSKDARSIIHTFMIEEFRSRLDRTQIDKARAELVERANRIIRTKYPEADMPVLRKYEMTRVDSCLKFTPPDSERVFYIAFNASNLYLENAAIVDIPCLGGCYGNEVFACDKEFEALADQFEKQCDERRRTFGAKETEYHNFLLACRYLEEVEAIVPLTEKVRSTIGAQSRALTVISADILSRIKSDFTQGEAA